MKDGATKPPIGERVDTVRVLVVDSSALQRGPLLALFNGDPAIQVVGWAASCAETMRAVERFKPDLITVELQMLAQDGLELCQRIMQEQPTPIVLVTVNAAPSDPKLVQAALEAGALAVVRQPLHGPQRLSAATEVLQTVKHMAQVKVIRRWASARSRPATGPLVPVAPRVPPEIIAIGASTGGPQTLQAILTRLPATFPLPVLVVQHIADGFGSTVVDWLRPQCALPIQLATAHLPLLRPGIYLAPTGQHLVVRGHTLELSDDPPVGGHRPSVTTLFHSLAKHYGASAVGVLLTGMGDDGAVGLRAMKQAGAITIAQDQASSVVFGMPAVAIGMGIVDHVLPPVEIAALLTRIARPHGVPNT